MKYDFVIKNANIINHDASIDLNLNIGVQNGLIQYVGNEEIKGVKVFDCTGKFITPTFVNSHSHAPMSLFKGLAEDVNIDDWFNEYMWKYESIMTEEDVYVGAKLAFYEMLNNGVTISAEHYFYPETIIDAALETGIKVDMAPTLFSDENIEDKIEETLTLRDKYIDNDRVSISFGPHSPYLNSKEDLINISNLAKDNDMKIHLHIGETSNQLVNHKDRYNDSPIKWLDSLGLLDNKLLLAHNLHYDDGDLELIGAESMVAYCPKTYYKLAMDLAGVNIYDVSWGLGTDGAASNATLDIVEQMRLLSLHEKDSKFDSTIATLAEVWITTMSSHDFFELNTGEIKEGYSADLLVWDLDKVNTLPNINPLASIIYSSDSSNIEMVFSSGELLKENGELLYYDTDFNRIVKSKFEHLKNATKNEAKHKF